MKSARHEPALVIVVSLMVTFAVHARGMALQSVTPDVSAPTPLEQALDEHACSRLPESGTPDSDAYGRCLSAQLLLLRNDFGRDLSKLSASERRTLDSSCSEIRTTRGRDAYLSCLSAQLVSLRNRRNRAKPPPSEAIASAVPIETAALASPIAPAPQKRSLSFVWIGAMLATVLVAAGGALVFVKTRRAAPRKCQVCGKDVPESGGLCPTCRHDAAETLRRAAADRVDQQRARSRNSADRSRTKRNSEGSGRSRKRTRACDYKTKRGGATRTRVSAKKRKPVNGTRSPMQSRKQRPTPIPSSAYRETPAMTPSVPRTKRPR